MNDQEDISESMVSTMKVDNLAIVGDLVEVGIDAVINDGILRDIPIIGVICGLGKMICNISDVLFTRKLSAFLFQLKDADADSRRKAIDSWESDVKYKVRVGETLLNMIHRCDDTNKAKWLSQLFYELVLIRQTPDIFMRAEKVLSSLSVVDVISFLKLSEEKYENLSLEEGERYANSGLYRLLVNAPHVDNDNGILDMGENPSYTITETGKLIHEILAIQ